MLIVLPGAFRERRVSALMDSKHSKPAPSPQAGAPDKPADPPPATGASGRVVHDERGNAVWDFLKQTSRDAIEATSRLLRKLEPPPELKIEDTQDKELRIQSDQSEGGGYDPYSKQAVRPRKPGGK